MTLPLSNVTEPTTTTVNSVDVPVPAGTVVGDVILLCSIIGESLDETGPDPEGLSPTNIAPIAGATISVVAVDGVPYNDDPDERGYLYQVWAIRFGIAVPAVITLTLPPSGPTAVLWAATAVRLTGVYIAAPVADADDAMGPVSDPSTITFPSVLAANPDSVLIAVTFYLDGDQASIVTPPAGMQFVASAQSSTNSTPSTFVSLAIFSEFIAAPGETGTRSSAPIPTSGELPLGPNQRPSGVSLVLNRSGCCDNKVCPLGYNTATG